jgi:hypothetical protein
MEIAEAKLAAAQILNEECERPTIYYKDVANDWVERRSEMTPEEIAEWIRITSVPRKNLWAQRKESPRSVTETPRIFQFTGTNFDLLMSVYGTVNENERPELIEYILRRVESGGRCCAYQPRPSIGQLVALICSLFRNHFLDCGAAFRFADVLVQLVLSVHGAPWLVRSTH